MNRSQFGILVASLRQDKGWTQSQLSTYARIDIAVVSQIERGVKKYMEPELLLKLADAFQLTTIGRREFFLASTGIEGGKMVRQPSAAIQTDTISTERALAKMVELLGKLRSPAFLQDVYSDILAVNYAAVQFFRVPPGMVENAASVPAGFNLMRLVFGKELVAKVQFLNNWDDFALSTMRFFRTASLRYRSNPYFQYLMKTFRDPAEYPLFDRYWRAATSIEQDRDGSYDQFSYDHSAYGHLSYAVITVTSVTAHGELLLNQYVPTDDTTKSIFGRVLAESGAGVIPLAPWPLKPMP